MGRAAHEEVAASAPVNSVDPTQPAVAASPVAETSSEGDGSSSDSEEAPASSGAQEAPRGRFPTAPGQPDIGLAVDHGHPVIGEVDGACPAGSRPSEGFLCGFGWPCCELECASECGERGVCAPSVGSPLDSSCQCHAAFERDESGECSWRGLVKDGAIDEPAEWTTYVNDQTGVAVASAGDGAIRLELGYRCSLAWAGAVARLPDHQELPDGAAVVFDYSGDIDVADTDLISVDFEIGNQRGVVEGFILDGQHREMRRCVGLRGVAYAYHVLVTHRRALCGACRDQSDHRQRSPAGRPHLRQFDCDGFTTPHALNEPSSAERVFI